MPQNKAVGEANGNTFTLLWSPGMMLTFLCIFKEQDNLDKCSNTGWKSKAWNECWDVV